MGISGLLAIVALGIKKVYEILERECQSTGAQTL